MIARMTTLTMDSLISWGWSPSSTGTPLACLIFVIVWHKIPRFTERGQGAHKVYQCLPCWPSLTARPHPSLPRMRPDYRVLPWPLQLYQKDILVQWFSVATSGNQLGCSEQIAVLELSPQEILLWFLFGVAWVADVPLLLSAHDTKESSLPGTCHHMGQFVEESSGS